MRIRCVCSSPTKPGALTVPQRGHTARRTKRGYTYVPMSARPSGLAELREQPLELLVRRVVPHPAHQRNVIAASTAIPDAGLDVGEMLEKESDPVLSCHRRHPMCAVSDMATDDLRQREEYARTDRSVAYVAIIGGALALAGFVVLVLMVVWDRRGARNYWDEV
jgi:hypothetical protein